MKRIFSILCILYSISTVAQTNPYTGAPTQLNGFRGGIIADSAFYLPKAYSKYQWFDSCGKLYFNKSGDSAVYYNDCKKNVRVLSIKDTTLIKQLISSMTVNVDSSIYATKYWVNDTLEIVAFTGDYFDLYNRPDLNGYVKYVDTNTKIATRNWVGLTVPKYSDTLTKIATKNDLADFSRSDVYNLWEYGVAPTNNGIDNSNNLQALVTLMQSRRGGVINADTGVYSFSKGIKLPTNGANIPSMKSISFQGKGAYSVGIGTDQFPSIAATVFQFNTSDTIYFDTRGYGLLEFNRIAIQNINPDTSKFVMYIRTTFTKLYIHNCSFTGVYSQTRAKDAAIMCGGGITNKYDSSINAEFQGYGTLIENNNFFRIQYAYYGRSAANANNFNYNNIWNSCGGLAPIICVGAYVGNNCSGNYFIGNLIEMVGYKYGYYGINNFGNHISNGYFDEIGNTIAHVYLDSLSTSNYVTISIMSHPELYPALIDKSPNKSNLLITTNDTCNWPQPIKFQAQLENNNANGKGLISRSGVTGSKYYTYLNNTTDWRLEILTSAGVLYNPLSAIGVAGGAARILASGATGGTFESNGRTRLTSTFPERVYIGDQFIQNTSFGEDAMYMAVANKDGIRGTSTTSIGWSATTNPAAASDVVIRRSAAGRLGIYTAEAGSTLGSFDIGAITATGAISGLTIATGQPSANGVGVMKLGKVLTGSDTKKYQEISVDGTLYYVPLFTTLP